MSRRPLMPIAGSRKFWRITYRKWGKSIGRPPKNRRFHGKAAKNPGWPRVQEYQAFYPPYEPPQIFGREKR